MPETLKARSHVKLSFKGKRAFANVDDPIHKDLSTAARGEGSLFVSCDETSGVDRLVARKGGWGKHTHFNLGEMFDLPEGPDGEMDIEGLSVDGKWLWIAGSHSLKRGKPAADDGRKASLAAMATVLRDPNRAFLGRVPLVRKDGALRPVKRDGKRKAACLRLYDDDSKLKRWLKGDAHIGPFLDLPSKENGLDIEGIAVIGDRVWLGLRGPVLREHAVILELDLKVTKRGWLKARRIDGKARYRKHLIDTAGQGIRDLAIDGDDLLILTGTVMAGDGPSDILRWRNFGDCRKSAIETAEVVASLPYRGPVDHPEGLVRWPEGGKRTWLVVHDSPDDGRLYGSKKAVDADVIRLPKK